MSKQNLVELLPKGGKTAIELSWEEVLKLIQPGDKIKYTTGSEIVIGMKVFDQTATNQFDIKIYAAPE